MENIINYSPNPKNVMFLINDKTSNSFTTYIKEDYLEYENYMTNLNEKYNLHINTRNPSSFNNFVINQDLDKFLFSCFMRKKSNSCPNQKFNPLTLKKEFYREKKNLINYFLKFNSN
jgi:hypothetical protein